MKTATSKSSPGMKLYQRGFLGAMAAGLAWTGLHIRHPSVVSPGIEGFSGA